MGTNYYLEGPLCPTCGRGPESLHIGKSSCGWCFALHVTDEIESLEDWQVEWKKPGRVIKNEYGDTVSAAEMLEIITKRRGGGWDAQELKENSAVRGPNGLARHRVDRFHCVGHGSGTWDLIASEFS